ncbi:neuromedin-S isoform X1 [Dromiciops gliroides]|uniref:neuromedin-S isoform X1 n=1 Tax=Dromiciops gliroides TaxID=33562 RepID=UPI001CC7A103|nr:neuromedin-S isoform X1 [Dromiciops gliroides]
MKQLSFQFPLLFFIYCSCVLQVSCSEFPKPLSHSPDGLDTGQLKRLALCLNQWTTLSKQPQFADLVMEVCTSIFRNVQTNEANQEVYKRGNTGTMGRPFFLFRPRNGRNIENNGHYNIQKNFMASKSMTNQLNDWAEPQLNYFI